MQHIVRIIFITAILSVSGICSAQTGYNIKVNVKQFANQYIYLGYYFGKTLPIKDSIQLNSEGSGNFKGIVNLPGGIYLIGYPNKTDRVEILVDKNQQFSIRIDSAFTSKKITLTGTQEGTQFQAYQNYMDQKGKQYQALNNLPNQLLQDQKNVVDKRAKLTSDVEAYRNNVIKQSPTGLLTAIFGVIKPPTVPTADKQPNGKYDSTYAWQYYKNSYWKNINLTDERLLRTPVYEAKFDEYFKSVVAQAPDSIIREADKLLGATIANNEMFKYHLNKLIDRYINPEYMGQDAVFVHLFEKYVATGTANWYNEKQTKYITDRAYSLMDNKINDKAPPLELVDTTGKKVSLYDIKSKYTVICFWDATCGHCKEVVPRLDSIYTAKWQKMGVTLLGVMTDGGLDSWKKYITQHNLTTWLHAYQPDAKRKEDNEARRPNYRQQYDIVTTPKLYLLDKDKNIKAKQLTFQQIDNFLTQYNKTN